MVRCYTCGKVIPHTKYQELIKTRSPEEAFNRLGLRRYCCRFNTVNTPVQVTREIYANRELTKNLKVPPAPVSIYSNETVSSLP